MTPAEVPDELVEKAADAMADAYDQITQDKISTMHQIEARAALAAVLPEIQAQAQQDLITDLLARHLWPVRHDLNEYPIEAVPKSVLLEYRNRLARLAATAGETAT
jgi:hypothetical protein